MSPGKGPRLNFFLFFFYLLFYLLLSKFSSVNNIFSIQFIFLIINDNLFILYFSITHFPVRIFVIFFFWHILKNIV